MAHEKSVQMVRNLTHSHISSIKQARASGSFCSTKNALKKYIQLPVVTSKGRPDHGPGIGQQAPYTRQEFKWQSQSVLATSMCICGVLYAALWTWSCTAISSTITFFFLELCWWHIIFCISRWIVQTSFYISILCVLPQTNRKKTHKINALYNMLQYC